MISVVVVLRQKRSALPCSSRRLLRTQEVISVAAGKPCASTEQSDLGSRASVEMSTKEYKRPDMTTTAEFRQYLSNWVDYGCQTRNLQAQSKKNRHMMPPSFMCRAYTVKWPIFTLNRGNAGDPVRELLLACQDLDVRYILQILYSDMFTICCTHSCDNRQVLHTSMLYYSHSMHTHLCKSSGSMHTNSILNVRVRRELPTNRA